MLCDASASSGPNTIPMASLVWVKLRFQAATAASLRSCTDSTDNNGGGGVAEEELALASELLDRLSPI